MMAIVMLKCAHCERKYSLSAFLVPCIFLLGLESCAQFLPGEDFKAVRKGTRKSYQFVCFAHIVGIVAGCNSASVRYLLL